MTPEERAELEALRNKMQKAKEYQKTYREKNKESQKAYQKVYREKNKARIKELEDLVKSLSS